VPDRATVDDLLAVIGVAPDADVTIAVDGEQAARDTPLRDGADVMLLSPMEGGAAAAGEATTFREGGAAAAGEATTFREGGAAAAGEATTAKEGGA
jgi:sulfur carrier protein ThiS